jgi:hypothetical protein
MIESDHPKLSIGAQCRLLSLSRSSFYYEPRGETDGDLLDERHQSRAFRRSVGYHALL